MTQRLHLGPHLQLPLDAITQKFAFLGLSGYGKTYAAGKFVEELLRVKAQTVILDPVGNWFGLRLGVDGKRLGYDVPVFGGEHGDIPLSPDSGGLVADVIVDRAISVVLDVSGFRKHQRKEFMTALAEQLFHRKKRARSPVHVVIEEAQVFIPQKAFKGEERLLGAMEDICKLGRNYGIGYSLLSQRPQAVNKDVLNQTASLFVFNMTGPQERKVMEGWIAEQGSTHLAMVKELPRLDRGEVFLWSPQWLKEFRRVKFGAKSTFDASATPIFGDKGIMPKPLAREDLEEIKEAMATMIQNAKAKDPKVLQAEIAKLARQLKDAQEKACHTDLPRISPQNLTALQESALLLQEGLARFGKESAAHMETIQTHTEKAMRVLHQNLGRLTESMHETFRILDEAGLFTLKGKVRAMPKPSKPLERPAPPSRDGADLGKGPRMLLTALAQHPTGLNKVELAIQTGYTINGHFNNMVGELSGNGWIEGRGFYTITAAGREALSDFDPLPVGRELLTFWLSHKIKSAGERKILERIAQAYPEAVSKDVLAHDTGYTINGHFNNMLGHLSGLNLIEGRGAYTAHKIFFRLHERV